MLWENTCDASTSHTRELCQSKPLTHVNMALLSLLSPLLLSNPFSTNYRIKSKDVLNLSAAPQAGLAHSEEKKIKNKHPHILLTFSTTENTTGWWPSASTAIFCNWKHSLLSFWTWGLIIAVWWQLIGQLLAFTEHIPLVCLRLLSGKKCFKVKASKEDKGESLLSHERC